MMQPFDQDEMDWLAFRYLSGELSSDECEAFERLLETDQAAREAVAAGVEWTQAVRFAYEDELLSAPSRRNRAAGGRVATARRAGWALTFAVVCASLLFVLWLGQPTGFDQQAPIAAIGNNSSLTAELADMWIATRKDLAAEPAWTDSVSANFLPEISAVDVERHSLAHRPFDDEMDDVAMPSWLMAAVAANQNELAPLEPSPDAQRQLE